MIFSDKKIKEICLHFNIVCNEIGKCIDTSCSEIDVRYNYKINDDYFLKINNIDFIDEDKLQEIDKLIKRYQSIGVYCPNLIKTINNSFSYCFTNFAKRYICYVEECVKDKFYIENEYIDCEFRKSIVKHLGTLASKYSNYDLIDTKSIWSIIELGPFMKDKDEKQENLDMLIENLEKYGYYELANRIKYEDKKAREKIKNKFYDLPRCVYQGDLNSTNIILNENNEFKGIIDFNMFGTEVNINCFLNETMYYLTLEDFKTLSAIEMFDKMQKMQNSMMDVILKTYTLNELELNLLSSYKRIIYLSFYPNVELWNLLLSEDSMKEKVIDLIHCILRI